MDLYGFRVLHWGGGAVVVRAEIVWFSGSFLLPVLVLSAIMGSRFMACGMFTWVVMGLTVFRLG